MTELTSLWLPILLSSVFVFMVSSVIHMFSPWHKSDYPKLEKQDDIQDALRPFNIPRGEYLIPRATGRKEMMSPEYKERMKKGPIAILTVWTNDQVSMGKPLILWFIYSVVVGIFAAYVAGRALPVGAHYLAVFRFAGVTAFLAYLSSTVANIYLVSASLVNYNQSDCGWIDLRPAHGRNIRLALAAMNKLENYFDSQYEPIKSTLLVLRQLILAHNRNVTEKWLYGMPFYYYNGNRFCYLWVHKKYKQPYLGIVDGKKFAHPDLLKEKRTRMKILLVNPQKDIPAKKIKALLKDVVKIYQ